MPEPQKTPIAPNHISGRTLHEVSQDLNEEYTEFGFESSDWEEGEDPTEMAEATATTCIDHAVERLGLTEVIDEYLKKRIINEVWPYFYRVKDDVAPVEGNYYPDLEALTPVRIVEETARHFPFMAAVLQGQDVVKSQKLHFMPVVKKDDGREYPLISSHPDASAGHKLRIMGQGLQDVITYMVYVEAGLSPKPDVIYGVTNPVMARIASQLGLPTLEEWREKAQQQQVPEATEKDIMDYIALYENFRRSNQAPSPNPSYEQWIQEAVQSRLNDPIVNSYIDILTYQHDSVMVSNTYEAFKQQFTEFYTSRGHIIYGRYKQMIARKATTIGSIATTDKM